MDFLEFFLSARRRRAAAGLWYAMSETAGLFMKDFKKQMERELRQDKILIICRQVTVL